jgi:hypothetical protein
MPIFRAASCPNCGREYAVLPSTGYETNWYLFDYQDNLEWPIAEGSGKPRCIDDDCVLIRLAQFALSANHIRIWLCQDDRVAALN